jgi:hypothetical protein
MTLLKNKTAYSIYAEQRFEPCTLRITASRLLNQTTRPPTMLVAHIIILKKWEYIHLMQFRELQACICTLHI